MLKGAEDFFKRAGPSSFVCFLFETLNGNSGGDVGGFRKPASDFFINHCAVGIDEKKHVVIFPVDIEQGLTLAFIQERFAAAEGYESAAEQIMDFADYSIDDRVRYCGGGGWSPHGGTDEA